MGVGRWFCLAYGFSGQYPCLRIFFQASIHIEGAFSYLISQQLPWGRNLYLLDPLHPQRAEFWTRQTPGHGWGHSHGPIPGGWSPHWPGCLVQTSRSGGAGRVRGRGWRKAAGRARHPWRCPASGGLTEFQPHPVPAPGQRGRAHHLGARNAAKTALLSQQSAGTLPTLLCLSPMFSTQAWLDHMPILIGLILNFLSSNNK